jgi:hypothetical protein
MRRSTRRRALSFCCTLDGSEADSFLEVPAWMFDRTACPDEPLLTAEPCVSVEALAIGLAHVLADGASGIIEYHSPVHLRLLMTRIRERPLSSKAATSQLMDLYNGGRPDGVAPASPELPVEARAVGTRSRETRRRP